MFAERDAADLGAVELGQGDDPLRSQRAFARVDQYLSARRDLGVGGAQHLHVRIRQPLGHRCARARAEDRQRGVLRGDQSRAQLDVHVVGPPRGHQRELVEGQRPGHAPRGDEGDALHVTVLHVPDQPLEGLVEVAVVDRDRVLVARDDASAEGEQQDVVGQLPAALGVRRAGLAIDPRQLVGDQLGAGAGDDRRQLVALRLRQGERLAHRHRPVHQLRVRSQHRPLRPVVRELRERQRGLQGRHSAANDQDLQL